MSTYKLCVNCKHHYETELSYRQSPNHFCERIIGVNLVTGSDIYLGKQCSDERIDGISCIKMLNNANVYNCGIEARYFEPKDSN